jgi:hypothetical protein
MKRNDWPVGDHGIRPNGDPQQCFYCGAAKGAQHRMGCVIRDRTVVVRTIVEHVIAVPEDWERSTIEFTDGSSCSDNRITALRDLVRRLDNADKCTCGMVSIEYVREATSEDEEDNAFQIANRPS